jgi:hypothetical protein
MKTTTSSYDEMEFKSGGVARLSHFGGGKVVQLIVTKKVNEGSATYCAVELDPADLKQLTDMLNAAVPLITEEPRIESV